MEIENKKNISKKNKIKEKEKKEPIRIKLSTLTVILLIIAVIFIGMAFFIVKNPEITNNKIMENLKISKIFKKQPDWIIEIDGQKVFNIDYNEFNTKIKKRLEEITALRIEESTGAKSYAGEVLYPKGWLMAESTNQKAYAYGQLHFLETAVIQLVNIEEYKGKVKSITFLAASNSIPKAVSEQVVYEVLESYGILDENQKEIFEKYVNIKELRQQNALLLVGKYYDSYGSTSMIADVYRKNGHFGYIPFEYNKTETGVFANMSIKE